MSSKILSLASPVFGKKFSPKFSEGTRVLNGEVPCLHFAGDNAKAMGIILRIIHYRVDDVPSDIDTVPLAILAVLCDKYDCKKALGGWIETWFSSQKLHASFSSSTPVSIGYALLAVYKFGSKHSFLSDLVSRASNFLRPDFRDKCHNHSLLKLLPEDLICLSYLPPSIIIADTNIL